MPVWPTVCDKQSTLTYQLKGTNIDKFIRQLFESGIHMPVSALLAGGFIAFLVGSWPILIGLPAVLVGIHLVVSAYPT